MLLQCQVEQELTASEKNAIDYVNKNAEEIADLTIAEIADRAFVSKATLFRALHKCGIEKISDIRYRIAKDKFIVNDTLNRVFEEYAKTFEQLDEDKIEKIAKYIREAKRVFILANGISKLVAEEMEFYLKFQRVDARFEDIDILMNNKEFVKDDDLILVFTLEDEHQELMKCVSELKLENNIVITCCCRKDIELQEYSDITVFGCSYPVLYDQKGDIGSSLGLRAIVRAIVEYLA